jgi:hypothetical protein
VGAVKAIVLFGINASMEAVIHGALIPRGFTLMRISSPLDVLKTLALNPGVQFIIAGCDPDGRLEPLNLLLENRLEVPILLLVRAPISRHVHGLLPRVAATLQWPFFPSDLVATIARLQMPATPMIMHA